MKGLLDAPVAMPLAGLDALASKLTRYSAAAVLWDLLTSILNGETDYGINRGRAEDLRRKATALVDGELSDPAFCTASIAEALGISARYQAAR